MKEFIKHFQRDGQGRWLCVESATLALPNGRVQVAVGSRFVRGTTYMGVDLAELLEEEYRRTGA